MASIDKAAIAFSIAITAIGAGFAFVGSATDAPVPNVAVPPVMEREPPMMEPEPAMDVEPSMMEPEPGLMDPEPMEPPMEPPMMEPEPVAEPEPMVPAGPQTHTVDIPVGTSVVGCEEDNACYDPADIVINAGDTVEWVNIDTAAHTVTSGSPADGPAGVFDSSLVMADGVYSFTFNDAGDYDYFCLVHPWMVGTVTVN